MNDTPDASMDAAAAGGDQSEQICRDFQRGVCSRGDKCKFAHPAGMGSEPKDQPMICRDFQNGTCNRSTCKYLHVTNDEEKTYLRTGQLPLGRPAGAPMMRSADSGIPICKDFLNNKCNRGLSCKFRHAQEEEMFGSDGGSGPSFFNEPPRKRPRDAFDSDSYRHLMEENVSLRRRVSEMQKEVSDLRATNEILLEQNARYRRAGGSNGAPSYGGGYGISDDRSRGSVAYPSRDTYAVNYSAAAFPASKPLSSVQPPSSTGYSDGYTKFE